MYGDDFVLRCVLPYCLLVSGYVIFYEFVHVHNKRNWRMNDNYQSGKTQAIDLDELHVKTANRPPEMQVRGEFELDKWSDYWSFFVWRILDSEYRCNIGDARKKRFFIFNLLCVCAVCVLFIY